MYTEAQALQVIYLAIARYLAAKWQQRREIRALHEQVVSASTPRTTRGTPIVAETERSLRLGEAARR